MGKNERHWRNVHFRQRDEDYFCAQVCTKAADWLRHGGTHEDFCLHLTSLIRTSRGITRKRSSSSLTRAATILKGSEPPRPMRRGATITVKRSFKTCAPAG